MPPKRILIVDDEEDIREVARLSLELTHGWETLTAASATEALSVATGQRPDAILLDVMMPEIDGPGTLRLLREREETRSIPVIFLTAKVRSSDRMHFDGLDVRGMIAKPFDPMKLGDQVAEALTGAGPAIDQE